MITLDKFKQVAESVGASVRLHLSALKNAHPTVQFKTIAGVVIAACAVGAIANVAVTPAAPDVSKITFRNISQDIALPNLDEQVAALEQNDQHYVREEKVLRGDTLADILLRLGVDDEEVRQFITSDALARNVLQVRPGKSIRAQTDEDGKLDWMQATLPDNGDKPARILKITRDAAGILTASDGDAAVERRIEMRAGNIRSSLFAATDEAQIPDAVAMQMVSMFETNVDFRMLQRGDSFNVVYESFWQNGELLKTGRVLAGEFTNAGKQYQAVWFDESANSGGYYSFDGKSLKKAFLKSPLEFTRISSGFSMRIHPISGKWKAHTGVDFAAVTGTPIRASGDGVVDFAGVQNGYGNVVTVKHWSNYSTLYGHMSRFAAGIRKGSRVRQGEVIGYVGSTGWATGPHLHYEFRVSNTPRDPMSVVVPNNVALEAKDMNRFKVVSAEMAHRFDLLRPDRGQKVALR
jgi:murein DD-endopeptidase MepM/ murein hydrolase activator NlpD